MTANQSTKLGPTGQLAGRRPTPLINAQEGNPNVTSPDVIPQTEQRQHSIAELVRLAQETTQQAVEQFRDDKITSDQLVEAIAGANRAVDDAVAGVPVPACPPFCELVTGHPYDMLADDATPARWHRRTFRTPDGLDVIAEVEERATADGVVLGAWGVSTIGDLCQVSPAVALRVAAKMRSAAELAEHAGGAR